MVKQSAPIVTPEECLDKLPELPLDLSERESDDNLRRAELRSSLLAVADLNQVSETEMVKAVVKNALGKLPEFE